MIFNNQIEKIKKYLGITVSKENFDALREVLKEMKSLDIKEITERVNKEDDLKNKILERIKSSDSFTKILQLFNDAFTKINNIQEETSSLVSGGIGGGADKLARRLGNIVEDTISTAQEMDEKFPAYWVNLDDLRDESLPRITQDDYEKYVLNRQLIEEIEKENIKKSKDLNIDKKSNKFNFKKMIFKIGGFLLVSLAAFYGFKKLNQMKLNQSKSIFDNI